MMWARWATRSVCNEARVRTGAPSGAVRTVAHGLFAAQPRAAQGQGSTCMHHLLQCLDMNSAVAKLSGMWHARSRLLAWLGESGISMLARYWVSDLCRALAMLQLSTYTRCDRVSMR